MAFEDDPEPVKGGMYMGMLIKKIVVTETEKIDSDGDKRIKKSFKMFLEHGMVMTEDRYVRSSESSDNSNSNGKGTGGGSSSSGQDSGVKFPAMPNIKEIEKECEREERRLEKQRRDAEKKRKQRLKEEKERRRKEKEEKEEAERKRREEEEAEAAAAAAALEEEKKKKEKKKRKTVSFGPTTVSVLPPADLDLPETPTADGPRAIWKFTDDDSIPEDYDLWSAQDVILFPPDYDNNSTGLGSGDSGIGDDSDDKSDGSMSFNGIWGYAPAGSVPGSDVMSLTLSLHSGASGRKEDLNKAISDLDCEFPPPIDVWIYPPGTEPPEDFPNHGKYAFAKNASWPPPIDEDKRENRVVGRTIIPDAFLYKANPQTIQAYSKWKKPKSTIEDDTGYKQPLGQWKYSSFDEANDETLKDAKEWAPQDVVLYPPEQEPPASHQALPQGTWVTKQNLIVDPEDPEGSKDRWAPPEVYLYPPGTDPGDDEDFDLDESFVARGTWSYDVGTLKDTWPPPTEDEADKLRRGVGKLPQWDPSGKGNKWTPRVAHVFPRTKAPSSSTFTNPQGVWKYKSGNEPKGLNDWETQEVMMYPKGQEPEESCNGKPHGVWGISKDAEPDDNDNWKPQDIWFYGPGEKPSNDCTVQGKWSIPTGKLDAGWPPKSTAYVSPVRKVGKLKIPGTFDNSNPPPPALTPTGSPKIKQFSPKKISLLSLNSTPTKSPSPLSRDKPPVSPTRRKSDSEELKIPVDYDSEQEDEPKEVPTKAPPKQPVRRDTKDSDDEGGDDARKGPKVSLGDFKSPFDYIPTDSSSSSTKKKKKNSTKSSSDVKEGDTHKGPKASLGDFKSPFDSIPAGSSSTSSSSKKKKKSTSLKTKKKKGAI
mmetsp:Transcript_27222/g.65165  ORF Transcript_27222/g.65165 Transcript_27222/m.65165 type:complete len:871 (+) Transcript_27222:297-2909(+)